MGIQHCMRACVNLAMITQSSCEEHRITDTIGGNAIGQNQDTTICFTESEFKKKPN